MKAEDWGGSAVGLGLQLESGQEKRDWRKGGREAFRDRGECHELTTGMSMADSQVSEGAWLAGEKVCKDDMGAKAGWGQSCTRLWRALSTSQAKNLDFILQKMESH